jgi:ketopantoate reductase
MSCCVGTLGAERTKAWQVTEAAQQIRSTIRPETVVVPLQNGVEAYDQLATVLGSEHVLDGLCHILPMATAPGVIRHSGRKALITIGERNNVRTPRLEKLVECLSAAELDTRVPDNIQIALWEKFEFVASFGGVGAITRAPAGVIRSVTEARSLLERGAGDCGPGPRRRYSGAERVGGKHDETSRLVATRRHGLDAARSDCGPTLGTRSAERGGRPAGMRLQFSNSGA